MGSLCRRRGSLIKPWIKGFSPLRVSPFAVWDSKGSKGKESCTRDRVNSSFEDVSKYILNIF